MDIRQRVIQAFKNNEFRVLYQPICQVSQDLIDDIKLNPEKINSKHIVGYEALIRWLDYSPDEFLPWLKEIHLLGCITQIVISDAAIKVTQFKSLKNKWISINIDTDDFLSIVICEILRNDIPPGRIALEVNESVEVKSDLISKFAIAQKFGCILKIDDWGKDRANLDLIFKVDYFSSLKIDQQFIKDISKNNNKKTIVKKTTEMAHSLEPSISVIAEGCETLEALSILLELDVDYVQGFIIQKAAELVDEQA